MSGNFDAWDDSLEEDRKASSGGGGKKWGYMWRPTESPTKIHLGEPEKPYIHPKTGGELPFRVGSNHFIPGGGPKKKGLFIECNFGEDCVTCAYSNPAAYGLTNVKQSPNLSKCKSRNYYAASGHIEEFFHLVEYYKDNENQEAGTFHQREKCEGKGCSFCKDKIPKVFGKRMYWEVSPSQWRHAIHDLHKKIQNSHCKCGGTIFVTSFGCSGC